MKLGRLVLCGAVLLVLVGCQKKEEPVSRADQPYEPLTDTDTASSRDPYERPKWYLDDKYGTDDSYATTDSTETSVDPYATDPMVRDTRATQTQRDMSEDVIVSGDASAKPGVRTHTVVKGDTLYKLARMYYNDQSKWRDIYEANRGALSSPDRLAVGMKLTIP